MIELIDNEYLIYDKEEFDLDEIQIKNHKPVKLEDYPDLPIISLDDILVASLFHKNTDAHKLEAAGIVSFNDIKTEVEKIKWKKSNLPATLRHRIITIYNDVLTANSRIDKSS